jgi:hypothetical protein
MSFWDIVRKWPASNVDILPFLVLPQYSCNLMLQVASTDAFRIAASCWILDSSSVQNLKPESTILSPQRSWSLNIFGSLVNEVIARRVLNSQSTDV